MATSSDQQDESTGLRDLGKAVRAVRKAKGMSQETLADAVGIDQSHIGKIERGERNLTTRNLFRIAAALNELPSSLLSKAGH